jgi:hypothetical protein
MIEQLFAPAASMWTPVPSQGFGWYQSPVGVVNRSPGAPGSTFGSVPLGMPEISAPALVAVVAMRRGQPQGPTTDQEIEEFTYDTFELLVGAGDVDVRVEGGRVTLTGSVAHKRLKHDLGEIVWAIPAVTDVQNNIAITARRRGRAPGVTKEAEGPSASARKQA